MARLNLNLPRFSGGFNAGTRGFAPDYTSLIKSDPLYHQAAADARASNDASAAGLTGGLQSEAIEYGALPDLATAAKQLGLPPNSPLLKALQSALNPQVRATAAGNPFSTQANAAYTHSQDIGQNMAAIGSRVGNGGMLQTSDLGVADQISNRAYGQSNQANLLHYLSGIQSAFDAHTQNTQTNANTLAGAAGAATTRAIAANPVTPGTGIYAGMPPAHRILPGLNLPKQPQMTSDAASGGGYQPRPAPAWGGPH